MNTKQEQDGTPFSKNLEHMDITKTSFTGKKKKGTFFKCIIFIPKNYKVKKLMHLYAKKYT